VGLHAQIHQFDRDVTISLCGEFRSTELNQLQAILGHFHRRGCRRFVLDLSQIAPLTPDATRSLQRMIGSTGFSSTRMLRNSAIRLLADTPAARPQTGCGELSLSVA